MTNAFVERSIECLSDGNWQSGAIKVFQPHKTSQGWTCRYEISWPGESRSNEIHGVDGFQALELAMRMVPTEIATSDAFKKSQLRLFSESPALNTDTLTELFPIHASHFGDEQ